jgi:hypothetical protein
MQERDTSGAKTARPAEVIKAGMFRIQEAALDRSAVECLTSSHGRPRTGRG